MSRITTLHQKPLIFSGTTLHFITATPLSKRLELRVAELDIAHSIEIKRLNGLLAVAKRKLFLSGRQRD
jgi:hypothetical protein